MKRLLGIFLAVLMIASMSSIGFAADSEEWNEYWETDEAHSGVTVFPGGDETQRRISWYSDTDALPKVTLTDSDGKSEIFEGRCFKTYDGAYADKVTVTGLKEGETYTYTCTSGDYTSEAYTIKTSSGSDFTALYLTDIHISEGEEQNEGEDSLRDDSLIFNEVLEAAGKNAEPDIILSAGDQATQGLESEYRALAASPAYRNTSFAPVIGNHDRKGVAYKYFKNVPNEDTSNICGSYIGFDYWFVKGDTLFMVMESNNGSGIDHRSFIRSAVNANRDVKWRVVMMHHDLYSGRIPHRESENKLLRLIWGPLFSEFDIDLALLGHSHYYTVSNVIYNNKVTAEIKGNDVLTNAPGTVSMVSGSLNHPRNDPPEELGLNDTAGYYYAQQGGQVLYSLIDFSEEEICVRSYSLDTGEQFNSLTLKKDSQKGGHPQKSAPFYQPAVNFIGTVYQFFNNISVYDRLKESGFEVGLFEVLFNTKNP